VIAQKAQSDWKDKIKKVLLVEDTRNSPVRGGSDNQPLDPIKETDPAGKVIYKPKTVSSDSTRSDTKFLGFLDRLQFSVHWLLLIIGALTPIVIATLKWHDETIRNIFAPYFLLVFSESIALVIAKAIDVDSAKDALNTSELFIALSYTVARILQLSGFLIYKRQFSIRRWLRNFLICLVALWSLNFIGLLNQPFIY